MEQKILEKLWQHEIKILDEIDRICKKHDITYFLMWGTLIGAVRHKGFIPWDDDIDLAMDVKNYKKFLRVAKKELSDEFFLQTSKTDKYSSSYFSRVRLNNTLFCSKVDNFKKMHHGIMVDIIPLYERNNPLTISNRLQLKVAAFCQNIIHNKILNIKFRWSFLNFLPHNLIVTIRDACNRTHGKYYTSFGFFFNKELFKETVDLEFCGKKYPAPKEYDKVLSSVYGDYMKFPPKEKQVAHNPGVISFDLTNPNEKFTDDITENLDK